MLRNTHLTEILKLSIEERLLAVQEIWKSIEADNSKVINPEQFEILEKRLEDYKSDPSIALTFEEAKDKRSKARAR
jgi:putative addiction module component (TIGR02574 family)